MSYLRFKAMKEIYAEQEINGISEEQALGAVDSPARKVYDYAQQHFVDGKIPVVYIQTVTTVDAAGEPSQGTVAGRSCAEPAASAAGSGADAAVSKPGVSDAAVDGKKAALHGLYIGISRTPFEKAAALSQKLNIFYPGRRARKVVAYLDPEELKTTWVGNKGIYRTRMMIEDGGELLLLAPGVRAFGENEEMDRMIREYGYSGTDHILELYRKGIFEGRFMAAAHLIQGSADGRFNITYATKPELLSREEIE